MEREVSEGLHIRLISRISVQESSPRWAMTELTLPPHAMKLLVAHWQKIG